MSSATPRLRAWARELRGTRPVPYAGDPDAAELLGVDVEPAAPHRPLRRALASLGPIAARTAPGCALAQERVVHAEQAGHRTLAATVRRQGLPLDRDADRTTEDARP
ncbi:MULTISPECIES: hypothetical protein [Streptomyces]|uniref:hypothetical protein n=1 Tax=Streptomyces TaxID=1883 RepID=UPI0015DAB0B1|nr:MULTISPECIES: hypothetical protein [Streptomyces]